MIPIDNSQLPISSTQIRPWPSTSPPIAPLLRSRLARIHTRTLLHPPSRIHLPQHHRPRLHDNVLPTHPPRLQQSHQRPAAPLLGRGLTLLQEPTITTSSRGRRPPSPSQTHHLPHHSPGASRHSPLIRSRRESASPRRGPDPAINHQQAHRRASSSRIRLELETRQREIRLGDC
jgi:hypothetical protein